MNNFFMDPWTQIGLGILSANRPGVSASQAIGQGGLLGINNLAELKSREEQAKFRQLQAEGLKEEMARAKAEAERMAQMQERAALFLQDNPQYQGLHAMGGPDAVSQAMLANMKPKNLPNSYEEWMLAGSPGTYADWIRSRDTAKSQKIHIGGMVSEPEYAKQMGKKMADQDSTVLDSADRARASENQIAQFRYLIDKWNESGGKPEALAPFKTAVAAYMDSFGMDPNDIGLADAGPGQALLALSNELTLGKIGGEEGMPANNFSDADRKFVTRTVPRIEDTLEGVGLKLEIQERMNRRAIEREEFFLKNSDLPPVERRKRWNKYVRDNPLFADMERQKVMTTTPAVDMGAIEAELERRRGNGSL